MRTNKLPTEYTKTRREYILFKNDCGLTDAIRRGGQYEQYLHQYIYDNNIKIEGTDVIDIGANLGCHTLEWADNDNVKVFAFEPQRIVFQQLCGNISLNGFDNVECFNVALGNENKKVKVERPNYYSKDTINIGDTHIDRWLQGGCEEVNMYKLDMYLEKFSNVSIIKIDVQGMEIDVLSGAEELIRKFKPFIFIEIEEAQLQNYNHTGQDVIDLLISMGYDVKKVKDEAHLVDWVAIPKV